MARIPLRRLFLLAVVVSLCVTASVAIVLVLAGDFDETSTQVLATTALISGYSLLAVPAGVLLDRRTDQVLAWLTISLAALGLVLSLSALWGTWEEEPYWNWILPVTAFAAACAQTAVIVSRRRPNDPPAVESLGWMAMLLAFVLASLVSLAVWKEIEDDLYYRLLGAIGILDLLASVLQPVVRRLGGSNRPPAAAPKVDGGYRFICSFDRPLEGPVASQYADRLRDNGRAVECNLDAESFGAAVGAAVAMLESETRARVLRIERLV